jgi:hypothetical protein
MATTIFPHTQSFTVNYLTLLSPLTFVNIILSPLVGSPTVFCLRLYIRVLLSCLIVRGIKKGAGPEHPFAADLRRGRLFFCFPCLTRNYICEKIKLYLKNYIRIQKKMK